MCQILLKVLVGKARKGEGGREGERGERRGRERERELGGERERERSPVWCSSVD